MLDAIISKMTQCLTNFLGSEISFSQLGSFFMLAGDPICQSGPYIFERNLNIIKIKMNRLICYKFSNDRPN